MYLDSLLPLRYGGFYMQPGGLVPRARSGFGLFTDPVQVTVLGGGVVVARTQDGGFSQYWGEGGGGAGGQY